jgi:hypothetical protein
MDKQRFLTLLDDGIAMLRKNQVIGTNPDLHQMSTALEKLNDPVIGELLGADFQKGAMSVANLIEMERDFVLPPKNNPSGRSKSEGLVLFLEGLKNRPLVMWAICRML